MIAVTDQDWQDTVAGTPGLALVDAWAPWCGPCRMFSPVLERFSEISGVPVYSLNGDENPDFMRDQQIMSIPTVLVYNNAVLVAKIVGMKTYSQLLDALEPFRIVDTPEQAPLES